MSSFQDGNGFQWTLTLNVPVMKRVKELTGVDLGELLGTNPENLAGLLSNPITFVDVLFAMVKPQADAAQITDEQFGAALTADSFEQAAETFVDAIIDFSPRRQAAILRQKVAQQMMIQDTELRKAEQTLSKSATNKRGLSELNPAN